MARTTASSTPAAAPPPATRRGTGFAVGLAAFAAALAYGLGVAKLPFGAPLVVLALGGLTLGLCALALFRMLDPLLRAEGDVPAARREPVRIRELEREKQLVLKAIREIENDYQMRKTSEEDYKELTARYRARAMRLIRELDAGDDYRTLIEQELKTRLSAVAAATRPCPACKASNDLDGDFCKKCGKPMDAARAEASS